MKRGDDFFLAFGAGAAVEVAFVAKSEPVLFAAGWAPGRFRDLNFGVILPVLISDFVGLLAVLALHGVAVKEF